MLRAFLMSYRFRFCFFFFFVYFFECAFLQVVNVEAVSRTIVFGQQLEFGFAKRLLK